MNLTSEIIEVNRNTVFPSFYLVTFMTKHPFESNSTYNWTLCTIRADYDMRAWKWINWIYKGTVPMKAIKEIEILADDFDNPEILFECRMKKHPDLVNKLGIKRAFPARRIPHLMKDLE